MTSQISEIRNRQEGFTLVELLIVILIIGILATIAIPIFNGQRAKAKNSAAQSAVRNALTAAKSYYAQNDSYGGLTPALLDAEESSLYIGAAANPAGGALTPGSTTAEPQNVLMTDGSAAIVNTIPANGQTVVLCSISKGDAAFCLKDVASGATQGTTYQKFTAAPTAAGLGAASAGWVDKW